MKSTMEELIDDIKVTARCLFLCILYVLFFVLFVGGFISAGVLIYRLFVN